jgi:hypothetical protein
MENQQPVTDAPQGDAPSREEVIKWYTDQIEIAELRNKLTVLQSETVQAEAMRLEALAVIASYKGKSPQKQNEGESESSGDEPNKLDPEGRE